MLIKIGKIVNTKGLKGEVKVLSSSDFKDSRFKKGAKIYLKQKNQQQELEIEKWSVYKNFDIIKFIGYNNINEVEKLKNQNIYAEELTDEVLEEGEYFFNELINYQVEIDNQIIGQVIDVYDQINRTYIAIKKNNGIVKKIPFIEAFISEVNKKNKTIIITPIEGLLDD